MVKKNSWWAIPPIDKVHTKVTLVQLDFIKYSALDSESQNEEIRKKLKGEEVRQQKRKSVAEAISISKTMDPIEKNKGANRGWTQK